MGGASDAAETRTPPAATGPAARPVTRRAVLRLAPAAALAAATPRPVAARTTPPVAEGRAAQTPVLRFALTDSDGPRVAPLLVDYERERGVVVILDPFPYADLLENLTIDLSKRASGYDLVSLDDPWVPRFAGGGALADLDLALAGRGQTPDPDFLPNLLALGSYPPVVGLRALPWIGSLQVFAWRADVLGELGLAPAKTWDGVLAVARAVTEAKGAGGLYGFGLRGQPGNPATTGFLPVLRGHGVDLFDERWEPQLETAEALAALDLHLALAALAPPDPTAVGHEELGLAVREGRIAQAADLWPDQLLRAYDPEQSTVAGTLQLELQPSQPGVATSHLTGTWLLGIPNGSQQVEAALDFILWLTAPAQQRRLLFEATLAPTRASVLRDPEATDRIPFLPGLLAAADTARPRPRTPLYAAVEAICGGYLSDAIGGRIGAEEALVGANQELRALMMREGLLTD